MSEQIDFTREEYELTKVALERSDVPAEALALLSAWIEGERLQVDDREDAGGINFCRMNARGHCATPPHRRLFFRAPALQAQSRALPQLERLLPTPVPGCGGGLEAGADRKGYLLRAVCPALRSEDQGGGGDQQAARQGIVSSGYPFAAETSERRDNEHARAAFLNGQRQRSVHR
jgi:hypothetical protein